MTHNPHHDARMHSEPRVNANSHHDSHMPSGTFDASFGTHEAFVGSQRADFHVVTDDQAALAFGRGGQDVLIGGEMGDDLIGGPGSDTLVGNGGSDHLDGGAGPDFLSGGAEADTLMGGPGNDYLDEGPGHGDLDGGPGNDILVGGLGADAFMVSPDSGHDVVKDFVAGPGIFDHVALMDITPEELRFDDTPDGVLISWDDGQGSILLEDVFKKDLAQNDFMFADDRYLIQPTTSDADHVSAISFAKDEGELAAPAIHGQTQADATLRFDGFEVKAGTDQPEVFHGAGERDVYLGLGGDDQLAGGPGNDHLAGDAGNDLLVGSGGEDDLRGGPGNDRLFGGDQADNLMGEDGNDLLSAGAGHDMLDGGAGNDIYHGGDGADAFIVAHGSGNDVVVGGFDAGPGAFDHVAFRDILPSEVTVADQDASPLGDGNSGVLVSWGDGSIFIEGVKTAVMSQDDFMFNSVEGGGFVDNPNIQTSGTQMIFQEPASASVTDHGLLHA